MPGPVEVGWQIWAGAIAGVIPFAIGAYEFGKRIVRMQIVYDTTYTTELYLHTHSPTHVHRLFSVNVHDARDLAWYSVAATCANVPTVEDSSHGSRGVSFCLPQRRRAMVGPSCSHEGRTACCTKYPRPRQKRSEQRYRSKRC